jgi:NADP-dependent 3-hydroxy acid dehydrogenase YdfG
MHSDTQRLAGKRIVVTGGTTGIGRATMHLLVEAGAHVLTCGRDQAALDVALADAPPGEGAVHGVIADMATREGVAALFAEADARLGGVDVLVANAALGAQPLPEMADADWRYVVETNLVGYLACAHAAMERMGEGGGHLLFVSSISPEIKAPGESVYAATKGGIDAFAETLRKEVADRYVRVSLIAPGSVGTDMQTCSGTEQAEAIANDEMLDAAEIAEAILFVLTRSPSCDVVSLRIEPRVQKTG